MKVLIACEFSGVVREAFSKCGHDAWSCDLIDTLVHGNHIMGDIRDVLDDKWDLMIAHPPCTHLASSGARWFPDKQQEQTEAYMFFMELAHANIPKICIENPIGVMSTMYRKPDQIVQPWMFGHKVTKATCLWLKGLPKLEPTNIVDKGEFIVLPDGTRQSKWFYDTSKGKKSERGLVRSITFKGFADALAQQYGNL
jgi:site-specific DNA-cytosine methylase